jgi:cytochrome c oxidase subunit III
VNVSRITPAHIDASLLPGSAFDSRAAVWWGNTLLLVIESMTVALLVVSYFYVAKNYAEFPPPRVDELPTIHDPSPDLGISTVNLVLLLASAAWALRVGSGARKKLRGATARGLALLAALGLASIALRVGELPGLKFAWDDNAYASVAWGILVLHLLYLIVGVAEVGFLALTLSLYEMEDKLAVDVTLTTGYWYWVVGTWVVLYAVVYWAPRVL